MKTLHLLTATSLLIAVVYDASATTARAVTLPNVTITASEVLDLWPGQPPGETGMPGPEYVLLDRPRPCDQIADISVPTLSLFQPAPDRRTGTGVLVIPGGGLERLAIEHEGYEVAEWLNEHGVAAFLLKYRVPPRDPEQRWKAGLQDAQRAMRLIRSRADTWQVDGDAIGTIGFSAGGEIGVRLSLSSEERHYQPVDSADTFSARPDFCILVYSGGIADPGTNALRDDLAARMAAHTPPMFIVHAFDDSALNSIVLMNALKRANIASELHIFGAGAHGFGVRDSGLPVAAWRDLCLNWLGWQGYFDGPAVRTYAREFVRSRDGDATSLPRFGAVLPSGDLSQAFAVQNRVVRTTLADGTEVAGYKGAFTSESAQSFLGLNGPLHAVLFKAGRIDANDGVRVRFDAARPLVIETEIAYVIAVDIGSKLRVPRQALTAVEAIVPAIELPHNMRALIGGTLSAPDLVAANVGSNQFIVGKPVASKDITDFDAIEVSLRRDGQVLHESTGAEARGGQAQNLMTLINQIIDQGRVIRRGDVILSGSLGGARPGEKGAYAADFGPLGTITFTIE